MPSFSRLALALPALLISGCAWMPTRDNGPPPPPNPPVFCYDTLGRATCYDHPQNGVGDLINAQLPPVVVVEQPPVVVVEQQSAIVSPAPATVVLTPAQIETIPDQPIQPMTTTIVTAPEEPPLLVKNPDPYPEPGNQATSALTDAPIKLKAPARR